MGSSQKLNPQLLPAPEPGTHHVVTLTSAALIPVRPWGKKAGNQYQAVNESQRCAVANTRENHCTSVKRRQSVLSEGRSGRKLSSLFL